MTVAGARSLVAYSARALPCAPLLVAFVLGLVVVALGTVDASAAAQLLRLRGVALLFAVALAFTFDDPVAEVADASPVSRFRRAAVRAAVQAGPALLLWFVVLAAASARTSSPLPFGRLTFEVAAMVLVGWAVAAGWRRARGEVRGGVVAGPALVVLVLVAHRLPPRLSVFAPQPETLLWSDAHRRWVALLGIAVGALVLALRDPLSRVRVRRRSR